MQLDSTIDPTALEYARRGRWISQEQTVFRVGPGSWWGMRWDARKFYSRRHPPLALHFPFCIRASLNHGRSVDTARVTSIVIMFSSFCRCDEWGRDDCRVPVIPPKKESERIGRNTGSKFWKFLNVWCGGEGESAGGCCCCSTDSCDFLLLKFCHSLLLSWKERRRMGMRRRGRTGTGNHDERRRWWWWGETRVDGWDERRKALGWGGGGRRDE